MTVAAEREVTEETATRLRSAQAALNHAEDVLLTSPDAVGYGAQQFALCLDERDAAVLEVRKEMAG